MRCVNEWRGRYASHFTLQLGRPELLNRIGDNIVVFDYINVETGSDSGPDACQRRRSGQAGAQGKCDALRRKRRCSAWSVPNAETLKWAGRGIGSKVETTVINPLCESAVHESTGTTRHVRAEDRGDGGTMGRLATQSVSISRLSFPVTTLGPGRRIGIWFQGCSIRCRGCLSMDALGAREGRSCRRRSRMDDSTG